MPMRQLFAFKIIAIHAMHFLNNEDKLHLQWIVEWSLPIPMLLLIRTQRVAEYILSIIITVFGSSTSLQLNSVFLSHRSSTSLQPPASQQCFSLTPLQHQPPAPAKRTEWIYSDYIWSWNELTKHPLPPPYNVVSNFRLQSFHCVTMCLLLMTKCWHSTVTVPPAKSC